MPTSTVSNEYDNDPNLQTETGDSTGTGHKVEYDGSNDRLNFESYRKTDTTYQYISLGESNILSDIEYTANLNINDDSGLLQYGISSYIYLYDSSSGGYIRIEMDMDEDRVSSGKIGILAQFSDGTNTATTDFIEVNDGDTPTIRAWVSGNTGTLDVDGTTKTVDTSSVDIDNNTYNRIRFRNGGSSGSGDTNGIDGWYDDVKYKYTYTTSDGITLTSNSETIDFDSQPNTLIRGISSNIETYVFASGDVEILEKEKSSDRLTLTYVVTSDAFSTANSINTIMDAQEEVTISGLDDTNLNDDYIISDFNLQQSSSYDDMYDMEISLERVKDRLY